MIISVDILVLLFIYLVIMILVILRKAMLYCVGMGFWYSGEKPLTRAAGMNYLFCLNSAHSNIIISIAIFSFRSNNLIVASSSSVITTLNNL